MQSQSEESSEKQKTVNFALLKRDHKVHAAWILRTNFEFVPGKVVDLFKSAAAGNDSNDSLKYGVNFTDNYFDHSKSGVEFSVMYGHEAKVSFIQDLNSGPSDKPCLGHTDFLIS
jgi:hypothetical protein